ncbi:MAG: SpoIIE family protein phosphatase [Planctomycetes bacterium]|nr:SpoIIE family protein phosphatase [Planctomycetota bacterium]
MSTSRSSIDSIRFIAQKVDLLIEALNGQGAASAGAAGAPAGGGLERALLPHLSRIAATLDTNRLFPTIIDGVVAVTGAERALLLLLEEGTKLRFKNGHRIEPQTLAGPEFEASRRVIKQVLQDGRPVCLSAAELARYGMSDLHGVLCAPVRAGRRTEGTERVVGALYADCSLPSRALGAPHLEALVQLAEHAGVALENAQMVARAAQEQQQRTQGDQQVLRLKDNIAKLYEVGQSLSSTLILEELLVKVVDHVVEISRAQRGFVMLLEGAQKNLVYKVGRDARQRTIPESQFAYSSTVAKRTIDEKKPVVMTEMVSGDLSVSMVQMELQSIMCVPLKEKEAVFGLVYVDSKQSNHEFEQADLEIVESLCGQASVAIVNAKLYKEAGERERLAHELNIASRLQTELLPKQIPPVVGLEMHGFLTPALEVGGDYYDFIPHDGTSGSVTIAIGDVSGKGVGAGIVMAMARSALRSLIQHQGVPTSTLPIMQSLNVMLCRDIPKQMFLTLNLLLWDAETRTVHYTPAGHEHLLIFRGRTGEVEKIRAGGVALGVLEQASKLMKEHVLQLEPGDQVLLYTDGVTEAMDILHEQFGLDNLVDLVRRHGRGTPQALIDTVVQAVVDFRGAADPHDDITLVAFRAV